MRYYSNWWKNMKQKYFLPKLANNIFTTLSFGLWMPKGAHDVFVFVIYFLGFDWQLF
jgi:hypothetical protein